MVTELETKVIEIIPRTYNVKSVRLKVEEGVSFKAGQFLFVALKEDKEVTRHLSISNSPTEKGYIEFTKKITESDFSKILNNLKSGDWVKIKYPFGKFTFEGEYGKIAFLSGGIGITPIRSITKYIIDKKLDIDMILLYGNQTIKDITFRDDFDTMQKEYPKFKVVHILSKEDNKWHGKCGHINSQVIKEEMPDYQERRFYICGPPLMVQAMKKILADDLSLPDENIITENFTGY